MVMAHQSDRIFPRTGRHTFAASLAVLFAALPAFAQVAERDVPARDRSLLEVTVYNGNLALVHETRKLSLVKGLNRLAFTGVSPAMQPATASVVLRSEKPAVPVDQIFAFDLLTPEALLRHSVGKTVRVIRTNPATGEEKVESAKVLSAQDGVVLQIGDRIETGIPGRIAFDALPATLREKPTLLATFDAAEAQPATLDLRYLTGGMTWQADYVAQLDKTGATLALQAVATITNNSGAAYEDATLRLVAGAINQGPPPGIQPGTRAMAAKEAYAAAPPVAPQAMGDMHLYPIPRKATLADRETRQIILFDAARVPVVKEFRIVGDAGLYTRRFGDPIKANAERRLRFKNEKAAGLGVPMPAGTVRVYGGSEHVSDAFLGADRIEHTAGGEEITLALGDAFDITATRVQTDFRTQGLPKNASESAYELKIRNATPNAVTVKVVEHLPGDWEILASSQQYKKTASDQVEWSIAIPAESEKALTYKARVQR